MKKMFIYEPAMCCDSGICGVGVDADLLRMSAVVSALQSGGFTVERFNLSSNPQAFVTNEAIGALLKDKGMDALPATVVEGEVVKTGAYPTNEEISQYLGVMLVPASSVQGGGCCGPDESCCPPQDNACGCAGGCC